MQIKAAVLYGPKTPLRVEEITLEDPEEHEVRVKVVATGMCHSDLHIIKGAMSRVPFPWFWGTRAPALWTRLALV